VAACVLCADLLCLCSPGVCVGRLIDGHSFLPFQEGVKSLLDKTCLTLRELHLNDTFAGAGAGVSRSCLEVSAFFKILFWKF